MTLRVGEDPNCFEGAARMLVGIQTGFLKQDGRLYFRPSTSKVTATYHFHAEGDV